MKITGCVKLSKYRLFHSFINDPSVARGTLIREDASATLDGISMILELQNSSKSFNVLRSSSVTS